MMKPSFFDYFSWAVLVFAVVYFVGRAAPMILKAIGAA